MQQKPITYRPDENRRLDRLIRETERLHRRINEAARWMDRLRLMDVLQNYTNPARVFWINLLAGLARGLGLTLGTAIVLSLLSILLSKLVGIPFFSDTIRELKKIIDHSATQP